MLFRSLESKYIEAELLQINKDMQKLVQLRRAPTLSIAYEDQWATLKTRASDPLNSVSQKCIRIQAAVVKRYFKAVNSVEEAQAPLLFLANAPYFPDSDYIVGTKGVSQNHLLSFDNNKVLKIINWTC